jgi:hypothetical protein
MLARALLLVALLVALLATNRGNASAADPDSATIRSAAVFLGRHSYPQTKHWLSRQPSVENVTLAADGTTVMVTFRDGRHALILGALTGSATRARPSRLPLRRLQPLSRLAANPGGRALVLDPFSSELVIGTGGAALDPVPATLRSAGFQVTQLIDTSVTVDVMATISQYNVVYIYGHTGSGAGGVLATGQLAPSCGTSSADGTVLTVGVAGSSQCYYAVNSTFFQTRVGQFPPNSLLFINGCELLTAAPFMNALAARGVGATVAWDNDSQNSDDYLSGAAFFNQMAAGATVAGALNTLHAAGYGYSSTTRGKATLSFRGNGSITLNAAAAGGSPAPPPTPTSVPTSTPRPTNVPPTATSQPTQAPPLPTATSIPPTATSTPRPTATSLPILPPALRAAVKPGTQQLVNIDRVDPGSNVQFEITFPNGDRLVGSATADATGHAHYSFQQQPSKITRRSNIATVNVLGRSGGVPFTVTAHYLIGFAKIDVSAQPRQQAPGKRVIAWIHTRGDVRINVLFKRGGHTIKLFHATTAAGGWASVTYKLPATLHAGQTVTVQAGAPHGKKRIRSSTTVKIV